MRIIVLYGVGTKRKKYRRQFFAKYQYLLDNMVSVTFRSLYNKVEIGATYDALYADIDTISESDKEQLTRYMKHYNNIPRNLFSLTKKGKLTTRILSPVRSLNEF